MTTTYDPHHPAYLDEADVRVETARVFDVCNSCRRCAELCAVFPTLFDRLDGLHRPDGAADAGLMTPEQQDAVADLCWQCKLCTVGCPYLPDRHEAAVDLPRLLLRAAAMRRANGHVPVAVRRTTRTLVQLTGRPGPLGRLASAGARAASGSSVRRRAARLTGVSSARLLPPVARQRFSTWFRSRPRVLLERARGSVAVFPTCLVEYRHPDIGKDLVRVYERNGIECTTADAACCGATWLEAGELDRFRAVAEDNVAALAAEVREGREIVVPQPTCSQVIRQAYPEHVDDALRSDAHLVADHTHDPAGYLMRLHVRGDTALDTDFRGEVPEHVTYHAPCRLRVQDTSLASRDLLKLTGAEVTVVQQCSGMGGTWGLRAANEEVSLRAAGQLGELIDAAGAEVVAGDCQLANTAIDERTGGCARHPLQVVARAYGLAERP